MFLPNKWTSAACRPMSTTVRHTLFRKSWTIRWLEDTSLKKWRSRGWKVWIVRKWKNARNTDLFHSNHLLIFSKNLWCFCIFSILLGPLSRLLGIRSKQKDPGKSTKTVTFARIQSSSTYQKSSIKNGHKVNHSKIWEIHVFSLRTRTPSRFSIRKVGSNFWGFHAEGQHGPSFGSTLADQIDGPYVRTWFRGVGETDLKMLMAN